MNPLTISMLICFGTFAVVNLILASMPRLLHWLSHRKGLGIPVSYTARCGKRMEAVKCGQCGKLLQVHPENQQPLHERLH